jgi:hypothetical protein
MVMTYALIPALPDGKENKMCRETFYLKNSLLTLVKR